jgi:hypothetical protein
MRFAAVTLVALCAVAAAASAATAKPKPAQDRYLAWVEADVTETWRLHRTTVLEDGCTRTANHVLEKKLVFRSGWQSVLVATRRPGRAISLGGKLRALDGRLTGAGGGADMNSCTREGVISDYALPMMGPIPISNASLDVRAEPDKPVVFSNFSDGTPDGTDRLARYLADALWYAPGTLTPQQLREAKSRKVDVTGSYAVEKRSADGAEVTWLVVNWKLTIRALPTKPRTKKSR